MSGESVVPCFDITQLKTYISACLVSAPLASDKWDTSSPSYFICDDVTPSAFWAALVEAGIGGCVCGFSQSNSGLIFQNGYGKCNGVCTGSYTCNGLMPVPYSEGGSASTVASSSAIPSLVSSIVLSSTLKTSATLNTLATLTTSAAFTTLPTTATSTNPATSTIPATPTALATPTTPATSANSATSTFKTSLGVPLVVNSLVYFTLVVLLIGAIVVEGWAIF